MKLWFEILGDALGCVALWTMGYGFLVIGYGMGVN